MGRVFDAMRRHSATDNNGNAAKATPKSEHREDSPAVTGLPSVDQIEEQLLSHSKIMSVPGKTVRGSASTAHTADVPGGSALPGGIASRDAGATLGAAEATRAGGFITFDVSPSRVEPHLIAVSQPRSAYTEQFRSLRTKVLEAGERLQMRAIVVTSAGIGEGKTLTALNLAWLLAQTEGVRALVIDSDLRRPCATDYLGIDAQVGLSEVLGGQLRLEDAIVRLEPAGLHLLPGGRPRDDVAELLSGPSYARLLTEVRRMFDYIIIDAPPLGIFTDANVLMSRADGGLLVVRAGKTRYSTVDKLLEQMPKERLLGVVLNRTEEQPDESSYYYHHRYYNRESKTTQMTSIPSQERLEEEVAVVN
ncbi:MAG TPA: CpsD/CapB family tyrosine-protein kinase [Pyrinomonadaceae bacterium]|jgi:capsular exopolysaccharide synthesis family protein|nr:CpsD/CapB family tyrosine-protein kinase [Pyrinomonadaceae bacterium]